MLVIHFIVHILGIDTGLPYGTWNFGNFWSGVAGSFLTSLIAFLIVVFARTRCQNSFWCVRHGKYPAANGMFKVCHKHHPDMDGKRPDHDMIHRLHHQAKIDGQHSSGVVSPHGI